jgi:hypothetical protein
LRGSAQARDTGRTNKTLKGTRRQTILDTDRQKRTNFDRQDGATKAPAAWERAPVAQLGAL